jgi:thioredoxin 1
MSDTPSSSAPLLVACLCAEWCGACREYRKVFEQVAQEHSGMRFLWVDIEDEADLVDPVEVENFPTLLIADADGARFFGTVLPHKDTLVRLLRSQCEAPRIRAATDVDVEALAQRLLARR